MEDGDVVQFWCVKCGHSGSIPARVFHEFAGRTGRKWHRLWPDTPVRDLPLHVRCHRCPLLPNGRPHRDFDWHIWQAGNWRPDGVFTLYQLVT